MGRERQHRVQPTKQLLVFNLDLPVLLRARKPIDTTQPSRHTEPLTVVGELVQVVLGVAATGLIRFTGTGDVADGVGLRVGEEGRVVTTAANVALEQAEVEG